MGSSSKQPTHTTQDVRTTTTSLPDYLQYPVMQNAARASVVGNRPYEAYTGQRVANLPQGYDTAMGIEAGLQAGGPQQYGAGPGYSPVQYNGPNISGSGEYAAQGYNPTQYNRTGLAAVAPYEAGNYQGAQYRAPNFERGPAYNAAQYQDVNFERGPTYGQTQYNQSAFTRTPDYNYSGYQAGNYGAGQAYSGLGAYANTPGASSYAPTAATLREFTNEDVDKYMSPYLSRVVDAQMERANQQFDRDMAVTRLQAARGGGYGDYGARVTEAILRSDHNRNVNDMVAQSLQSGFRDATGLMQSWRDADLQRQGLSQADRQFGGTLNQGDRQFGRTSDLNDAQFRATFGLSRDQELNQRNQSDRQFGANINAQQAQFANAQALQRDQALNQLGLNRDQFAADFASGENQFAANLSQQERQELNRLMLDQRQFGTNTAVNQQQFAANLSQQERDTLNRLGLDSAQFGAQFDSGERQFGSTFGANERQFANDAQFRNAEMLNRMNLDDAQFAAQFAGQQNQFGAEFGAAERQYQMDNRFRNADMLNRYGLDNAQFAAQFAAGENQYGYGMNQEDRQFAAGYGLDARNQFYNQQMGIADAYRRDADTRAQFEQANLDTRYQDFLDSRDWDQNQISWLTSILYGTPERVNNNYQNIYQNPLAQGIGAAASIYGLANAGAR